MYTIKSKVYKDNKVLGYILTTVNNTSFFVKRHKINEYRGALINAKVSKDNRLIGVTNVTKRKISDYIHVYHGSHEDIVGEFKHTKSRKDCDFGQGFYMGNEISQAQMLVAEDTSGVLYELLIDTYGLKAYTFKDDILWALYIGVNRGLINADKYPKLKRFVSEVSKADIVIGLIADDRMFFMYEAFMNGTITSKVLTEALKYVKYGKQYVAKTEKACKNIIILNSWGIHNEERKKLTQSKRRLIGSLQEQVSKLQSKYRRQGKYIDEVLRDWEEA